MQSFTRTERVRGMKRTRKIVRGHGKVWELPVKVRFEMNKPRWPYMEYKVVDYREPKEGEFYLSGAKPVAYKAPNDFSSKYLVVLPLIKTEQISHGIHIK